MFVIESLISDYFQENIWFIINDGKTIIIDPGVLSIDKFVFFFDHMKIRPLAIINTHAHPDHIYSVAWLQKEYSIPFFLFLDEKSNLEKAQFLSLAIGLPDLIIPENIQYIKDSKIKIEQFNIDLLHTPGHTKGSICLKMDHHLFTGDTLFQGSIGRVDLPGGSMATMKKSIEIFKQMDDNIIIYPGHGPISTIGYEKQNNPYF